MDFYLTYGYTPLDRSIFKKINKLLPAHYLVLDKRGLKVTRYWELRYSRPRKPKRIEEYEEGLLNILEESVRSCLVSDVPLGAFLSGGIDSSVVVALMKRISRSRVKTFSIGFDREDYSELEYARKVSKILETEHREFIMTSSAVNDLEKLVWHHNEPFADSSALPTYHIAKNTAKYIRVVLTGDGGDESFAGYDRYRAARLSSHLEHWPRNIFGAAGRTVLYLNKFLNGKQSDFLARRGDFLCAMHKYGDFSERYAYWMGIFSDEEKNMLYMDEFKNMIKGSGPLDFMSRQFTNTELLDPAEKAMKTDIETNLPGDLTVKMDIATMANSMEARAPFLDRRLMEFAASIPSELKLKGRTSKYIIKKLALKFLPKEILSRRKMGFAVPIGGWFKNELKSYISEILLDRKALGRGYFKEGSIEKLISEHTSGIRNNKHKLWSLLNLELWHKVFMENGSFEPLMKL